MISCIVYSYQNALQTPTPNAGFTLSIFTECMRH